MDFIINCKSSFSIIFQKENKAAFYAAKELSKYIKLSTGCEIEIKNQYDKKDNGFFIGEFYDLFDKKEVENIDFNGDGFLLKIESNAIYVTAKNGRGLIYGTYRFLEKYFGVRFFNIDCELVPKQKNIVLSQGDFIEKPDFVMRSYLVGKVWFIEENHVDFYLKLKQNNEHCRIGGEQISAPEYGGPCPMYGRGGTHNMCRYVPRDKYAESHPEFYAEQDSVLKTYSINLLNGITLDGQLDTSMEISVAKVVIEEMKRDILAHPEIMYFQFEQEDGEGFYTYPEESLESKLVDKYGRSGILIRFCNVLARELQKWADKELNGRKIYIVTFAYSYTRYAPVKIENNIIKPIDESVIAADNLVIRLALVSNCAYPYLCDKQKTLLEQVNGWKAVCNKYMFWAYDKDEVSFLWYYPTLHNINENIKGLKELGVIYAMFESAVSSKNDWQTDIKNYIYSNMFWNSNQSVNSLYEEYMQNYYGVISEYVKKIIAIFENFSLYVRGVYKDYNVETFDWNYRHQEMQSEGLIDRVLKIIDEAENVIQKLDDNVKETYVRKICAIKASFLHMKLNVINYHMFECIEKAGITRFNGVEDIPKNAGQTIHNVEMVWMVKEKLVIPDDIKSVIKNLDPYSISDSIDLDNIH